jgi:hypothetical protein
MKNLLTILFTGLLVNFAIAQGSKAATAKPSAEAAVKDLVVLKELSYDFGKIQQGRPVTHDFEIANTSSDTLKLEDVRASCGCTTPVWKKDPVAPHSNTKITVGYNSHNEGAFEKTVTMVYNGGKNKVVTIKGEVYKSPSNPAPENSSVQFLNQTSN